MGQPGVLHKWMSTNKEEFFRNVIVATLADHTGELKIMKGVRKVSPWTSES